MQGRLLRAVVQFVLAALLWIIWMGWIVHLWSIIDAAIWRPRLDERGVEPYFR